MKKYGLADEQDSMKANQLQRRHLATLNVYLTYFSVTQHLFA